MSALLLALAQYENEGGGGALGAVLGLGFAVVGLVLALAIPALLFWKVFVKAGQPGWASVVPIYNLFVLAQVAGKPAWWGLLMLIPCVNIVIIVLVCLGVAEKFGKSTGYGIGLAFLGIVFFPMLGFGDARYRG